MREVRRRDSRSAREGVSARSRNWKLESECGGREKSEKVEKSDEIHWRERSEGRTRPPNGAFTLLAEKVNDTSLPIVGAFERSLS